MDTRSRIVRVLREPLVLFLLVGVLLFAGYRALNPATAARDEPGRIVLTEDDLRQITVAWLAQGRPPPAPDQVRNLADSKVREEVLYREALALGLDRDDTIVKRRLVQKMEFLAEDVSALRDPTPGELKAWFDANARKFALPPRVTFRHVYFSPDVRGTRARDDGVRTLTTLHSKTQDSASAARAGDPFMFQKYYGDRTPEQVAKIFGNDFANVLFDVEPGAWKGPFESGLGWHVVFVASRDDAHVPPFDDVEDDVRSEWMAEQRAAAKRRMYEAMKARYEIVLPPSLSTVSTEKVASKGATKP
jgi:peptidyl-prolyl cis-trans isomerase C